MQDIKLMIQHLKKYIPCEINCQITNYTHKYLRLDSLSLWSQSVFSVREVSQKKLRDAHFKLFKDWQYTNLAVCLHRPYSSPEQQYPTDSTVFNGITVKARNTRNKKLTYIYIYFFFGNFRHTKFMFAAW